MANLSPWLILFGLGAFHGLNPGMGWLFAVALGLQEQKRIAVWNALPPIALGHALSVAIIIGLVLLARVSLPHSLLKWSSATILLGFGLYRLVRSRHPNWVGMRVGFRDLTLWSFIMASAHGAGLMLVPLFIRSWPSSLPQTASRINSGINIDPICGAGFGTFSTPGLLTTSVGVHALGHFLAAGLVAFLVYEKLGVAILRRAWFNLDFFWAVALVATSCLIVLLPL